LSQQQTNSLLTSQVIAVYKDRYLLEGDSKPLEAEVSGRFRYLAQTKADYPQIGDVVGYHLSSDLLAIIETIHERRSTLERLDVGTIGERHILAVNIDICFITLSLNLDYNIKKLRNYLSLTAGSQFETIILLTKKDLCPSVDAFVAKTKAISEYRILAVSAYDASDIDMLKSIIKDKTAVFIGSSGVGKSTLINQLLGDDRLQTNTIRMGDAQGRHTTVSRELIRLDNGGKVIDTPGIRIVSSYLVSETDFEDILALSEGCRYRDCQHQREPGCRVQQAIHSGELDPGRFQQYQKALKQSAYNREREHERLMIQERINSRRKD